MMQSVEQLEVALNFLKPQDYSSAMIHLALPVSSVLGFDAHYDEGVLFWRNEQIFVESAKELIEFVQANRLTEDDFINLDTPPIQWVKVLASGSRLIAYGSDLLFNGPLMSVDVGEGAQEALFSMLELWRGGEKEAGFFLPGENFVVEGNEDLWIGRNLNVLSELPALINDDETIATLEEEMGVKVISSKELDVSADGDLSAYFFKVGDLLGEIRILNTGSTIIFQMPKVSRQEVSRVPLDSWTWLGQDAHGKAVAEHSSGIRARF